MDFKLEKTQENGIRVAKLTTAHGVINTPFFMPVGTVGSVKGVSPEELRNLGAQIVLSNTYHLYLRPGEQLIKELGGLHEFMRWSGPILTDSGGYQVFSLGKKQDDKIASNLRHSELDSESIKNRSQIKSGMTKKNKGSLVKITEDGVEFTSHLDGSKHIFTPEKVIDIQLDLGVDILMPLDVCPSGKAGVAEIEEAVRLTIEWARRSKLYFDRKVQETRYPTPLYELRGASNNQTSSKSQIPDSKLKAKKPALFGIVQGGLDPKLREYCASELMKLDFDGYSIGGLAVDHETRDMWKTVELMGAILPKDKPRYLMGVGTPEDIYKAVHLGVDMFDCVLPTRLARHGSVYVRKPRISKIQETTAKQNSNSKLEISKPGLVKSQGMEYELVNLLNSKYRTDGDIIEKDCDCPACAGGFSRAYISHLIRSNEILGLRLASVHNLRVYLKLMEDVSS